MLREDLRRQLESEDVVAIRTRVVILYCGQGTTTLVEVDSGAGTSPVFLALVDCGGTSEEALTVVGYIMTRVRERGRLDCVAVSHQDGDHHRILRVLGERMEKEGFRVGKLWVGGLGWKPGSKQIVRRFADRTSVVRPEFDVPEMSDYKPLPDGLGRARRREELGAVADYQQSVFVRRLVTSTPGAGEGGVANTSSVIFVVEDGTYSVVLPGDATTLTMASANAVLARYVTPRRLIPPVTCMEVPHHGSIRTAVDNYDTDSRASSFTWKEFDEFVSTLQPTWAAASAGPLNVHNHPFLQVLQRIQGRTELAIVKEHGFVACDYEPGVKGLWDNLTAQDGIYCTLIELPQRWIDAGKKRGPRDAFDFGDIVVTWQRDTAERDISFRPLRQRDSAPGAVPVYAEAPR